MSRAERQFHQKEDNQTQKRRSGAAELEASAFSLVYCELLAQSQVLEQQVSSVSRHGETGR